MNELLELTSSGLYCNSGDFHIPLRTGGGCNLAHQKPANDPSINGLSNGSFPCETWNRKTSAAKL